MNNDQNLPRVQITRLLDTNTRQRVAHKKLSDMIDGSNDVLVTATTVFPFTLFPDTVTIDREKLTVTHRVFFAVAEVVSIQIEDILNITADVGPFFGSLKVLTRFFDVDKPYGITFLWRSDAVKIKCILQGYITVLQKNIDCSALPPKELARMLEKLGAGE